MNQNKPKCLYGCKGVIAFLILANIGIAVYSSSDWARQSRMKKDEERKGMTNYWEDDDDF